MKLLVMSDTHQKAIIQELIEYEQPDLTIHCGDSEFSLADSQLEKVDYIVRGNCDYEEELPLKQIFQVANFSCLVTHGDKYGIPWSFKLLKEEAKKSNCNLIFYGHSHVVDIRQEDDLIYINPGSTTNSRCSWPESYLVLDVEESLINAKLKSAKTLEELEQTQLKLGV